VVVVQGEMDSQMIPEFVVLLIILVVVVVVVVADI
jgi:hypothetical protein